MMKNEIGFVYKITSPSNRVYVGSTINFDKRMYQYKNNCHKSQIKIYNSIKKYGWENHKVEIIWSGLIKDMLKNEAMLGLNFNVLDQNNLNLMLPRLGTMYNTVSQETRIKMSNAKKGQKMSETHKKIISNVHTGKIVSLETRQKMSEWQIGRKMSKEAKQKMSISATGKKVSIETRRKISDFNSIPILQFDLEGRFINEWVSATEVQKKLKINSGHIRSCCLGKRKTSGRFIWKNKT
jgi:group I intron endonuclease